MATRYNLVLLPSIETSPPTEITNTLTRCSLFLLCFDKHSPSFRNKSLKGKIARKSRCAAANCFSRFSCDLGICVSLRCGLRAHSTTRGTSALDTGVIPSSNFICCGTRSNYGMFASFCNSIILEKLEAARGGLSLF